MRIESKHTKLALLIGGAAFLAACSGGDDVAEPGIETLGATFQQAFAQGPNDAPIDVSNADLALNLGIDPFEL